MDYLIKEETLIKIAEAIRQKTGKTEEIPVNEMDERINFITDAGDGSEAYEAILNGEW